MATRKMRYELKLLSMRIKPNKLIERKNANWLNVPVTLFLFHLREIWHPSHCCEWNVESIISKYSYFYRVIRYTKCEYSPERFIIETDYFLSAQGYWFLVKINLFPSDFLTHFSPVFHFYTPWKRKKTKGFLTFSRGS